MTNVWLVLNCKTIIDFNAPQDDTDPTTMTIMEVMGVFDSKELAKELCTDWDIGYGPLEMNKKQPEDTLWEDWIWFGTPEFEEEE